MFGTLLNVSCSIASRKYIIVNHSVFYTTGDKGELGRMGDKGDMGPMGEPGLAGQMGIKGEKGIIGNPGPRVSLIQVMTT